MKDIGKIVAALALFFFVVNPVLNFAIYLAASKFAQNGAKSDYDISGGKRAK